MSFEEEILIENVQHFSVIWNTKDKEHRNLLVVENAWRTIAAILEESVEKCKEAWKSIRAKYIRERKFILTLPSGSGSYTGNWPLFSSMQFLAPVIQTRRTSGNVGHKKISPSSALQMPSTPVWSTMLVEDDGGLTEEHLSTEEESLLYSEPTTDADVEENTDLTKGHTSRSASVTPKQTQSLASRQGAKKRTQPLETPFVEKLFKKCSDVGDNINRFMKENTENVGSQINKDDRTFSETVGEELTKIKNNVNKLKLKSKILNMIAEEQEREAKESNTLK